MTQSPQIRAGIYARVSTGDGWQTPDSQLLDLRKFAAARRHFDVDRAKARELLDGGQPWPAVARRFGVTVSTLRRRLAERQKAVRRPASGAVESTPLPAPARGRSKGGLFATGRRGGKHPGGRPRRPVDLAEVGRLLAEGHSLRQAARRMRLGYGTVWRAIQPPAPDPELIQNSGRGIL
jgi:hypothetical protein